MCGCNKNKKRATTTVSTASQQPILTSVAKPTLARAPPPSRPAPPVLSRLSLPRPKPVRSTLAASIPRGPRNVQRKKKTIVLKRK